MEVGILWCLNTYLYLFFFKTNLMIIYISTSEIIWKKQHLRQVFRNIIALWSFCVFKIHNNYCVVEKQVLRLYLNIAFTTKFYRNRFILESMTHIWDYLRHISLHIKFNKLIIIKNLYSSYTVNHFFPLGVAPLIPTHFRREEYYIST